MFSNTLLLLISFVIITRFCFAKESRCNSRFDYEEKLLEKVIRTEIQMQQTVQAVEAALEKLDEYHAKLEEFKTESKESTEFTLTAVEDNVHKLEEQITQYTGTRTSATIAFNVKGVVEKSPTTGQIVVFQSVILNTGDAFDLQTGVFTSKLNGTFMFSVQVCTSFRQHGSFKVVNDGVTILSISNYNYASGLTSSSGTVVHRLKEGGRVWVQNEYDAGSSANLEDSDSERACWNQFSGVLVDIDKPDND